MLFPYFLAHFLGHSGPSVPIVPADLANPPPPPRPITVRPPPSAPRYRRNACGSPVPGFINYLDVVVKVPVEQLVDPNFGDPKWTAPFTRDSNMKDYHHFENEGDIDKVADVVIGDWLRMSNGTRKRIITYRRKERGGAPALNIHKEEIVDDKRRRVEIVSTASGWPDDPNFRIITRTCISPGTRYQVDIWTPSSTVYIKEEIRPFLREGYSNTRIYLKKLENHPIEFPYNFRFEDLVVRKRK